MAPILLEIADIEKERGYFQKIKLLPEVPFFRAPGHVWKNLRRHPSSKKKELPYCWSGDEDYYLEYHQAKHAVEIYEGGKLKQKVFFHLNGGQKVYPCLVFENSSPSQTFRITDFQLFLSMEEIQERQEREKAENSKWCLFRGTLYFSFQFYHRDEKGGCFSRTSRTRTNHRSSSSKSSNVNRSKWTTYSSPISRLFFGTATEQYWGIRTVAYGDFCFLSMHRSVSILCRHFTKTHVLVTI